MTSWRGFTGHITSTLPDKRQQEEKIDYFNSLLTFLPSGAAAVVVGDDDDAPFCLFSYSIFFSKISLTDPVTFCPSPLNPSFTPFSISSSSRIGHHHQRGKERSKLQMEEKKKTEAEEKRA